MPPTGVLSRGQLPPVTLPKGETCAASIIFNPATRRGAVASPRIQFRTGWRRNACFTRAPHSSAVHRRQVRAGFVSKAIGLPRDLPRPRRAPPPPPTIHDRTNYRSAEKDHSPARFAAAFPSPRALPLRARYEVVSRKLMATIISADSRPMMMYRC